MNFITVLTNAQKEALDCAVTRVTEAKKRGGKVAVGNGKRA